MVTDPRERAANVMADHVLARIVGDSEHLSAQEPWRGPVVLHMKHDRGAGIIPTLDDTGVRELIDVAVTEYQLRHDSAETSSRTIESTSTPHNHAELQSSAVAMSRVDTAQFESGLMAAAIARRPIGGPAAVVTDAGPELTSATVPVAAVEADLGVGCD